MKTRASLMPGFLLHYQHLNCFQYSLKNKNNAIVLLRAVKYFK